MLSNFESLDDGNNQKTRGLVPISAFVQMDQRKGKKGLKKKVWNYSGVNGKTEHYVFKICGVECLASVGSSTMMSANC